MGFKELNNGAISWECTADPHMRTVSLQSCGGRKAPPLVYVRMKINVKINLASILSSSEWSLSSKLPNQNFT
jgi:hypothetical protein